MGCCQVGVLALDGAGLCCLGGDVGEVTTASGCCSVAGRLTAETATIDRIDLLTAAGGHAWVVARLRRR